MLIAIAWVIGIFLVGYLVIRTVIYFRREAHQAASPHPEPPEEILRDHRPSQK